MKESRLKLVATVKYVAISCSINFAQEIEPVCGQALCRSFPLDSAEAILEIVKKIVPKKLKSSDSSRRRNPSDRIGTTQISSSRRPKDLGFHNPNSVGLLGAATTSRSTVPPLMSTVDFTNLSAVAAMAALKSSQSRGSLLPTANPAIDISRLISSSSSGVLPHLIPQAAGTDPATLSALLSTHGPAIDRIFQQDATHQSSIRHRSRERRHRSQSSSGESDRYHRDYHHRERRRHRDEEGSYRYRSRLGGADAKDTSLFLTAILFAFSPTGVFVYTFKYFLLLIADIIIISGSLMFTNGSYFNAFTVAESTCTVSTPNIVPPIVILASLPQMTAFALSSSLLF